MPQRPTEESDHPGRGAESAGGLTEWLLTKAERANPQTVLDNPHPGEQAWSVGNHVRPLVHGATYFAELKERIEETQSGDLIMFTDWRGDPDQQLTDDPASTMVRLLGDADRRGVDVRGLIWRSHWDKLAFSGAENRQTGEQLQAPGRGGAARHAGAHRRFTPPEARRDPVRRTPRARYRVRRWHRPVPLAARRCAALRRPAGPDDGAGVRRTSSLARHPSRDLRASRLRRRGGVPGALGGSHPTESEPDPSAARPTGRERSSTRPVARTGSPAGSGAGWYARGPAPADVSEPSSRPGLSLRPRWRAQCGEGLYQGPGAG